MSFRIRRLSAIFSQCFTLLFSLLEIVPTIFFSEIQQYRYSSKSHLCNCLRQVLWNWRSGVGDAGGETWLAPPSSPVGHLPAATAVAYQSRSSSSDGGVVRVTIDGANASRPGCCHVWIVRHGDQPLALPTPRLCTSGQGFDALVRPLLCRCFVPPWSLELHL